MLSCSLQDQQKGRNVAVDFKTDFAITKFGPPSSWRSLVRRQDIHQRLAEGWQRKLVLVCAPAGFGKTTLLAQWYSHVKKSGTSACWLSLEGKDREPTRFLLAMIRAIQSVHPDLAKTVSGLVEIRPDAGIDRLVDALINNVAAFEGTITLFLDDYHEVDNRDVAELTTRLLTFAPRNLHLCISCRHSPSFSLVGLRVRDEIIELRSTDLRFSNAEIREFMCTLRGHDLTEDQLQILQERTEGWIAALQLTSLSLEKPDQGETLIPNLSGGHREITDYLTADLFIRLPEDIKEFLLASSVLEKMTASLCDHLTGRHDSAAMLQTVEQANLFLIALDSQKAWYRYHHLFRSFLRNKQTQNDPVHTKQLYRLASDWFSDRGIPEEAIDYARKSGDIAHMAMLVEKFAAEHVRHGRIPLLISWIRELPPVIIDHRPWLSLYLAYALFHLRRHEEAERVIQQGIAALKRGREDGTGYTDKERQDFDLKLEAIRLCISGTSRYNPDACERIVHLLEVHPDLEDIYYCTLFNILGYLQTGSSNFEQARTTLRLGRDYNQRNQFVYGVVYADCFIGMIEDIQGHAGKAVELYVRAEAVAAAQSGPHSLGHDLARLLHGIALLEQNRIEEARPLIEGSGPIAADFGPLEIHIMAYIALSRMAIADGNMAGAFACLEHPLITGLPVSHVAARITLCERQIRLLLLSGRKDEAVEIAEKIKAEVTWPDGMPEHWDEAECMYAALRCRTNIAQGCDEETLEHIRGLQCLASGAGRRYRQLEFILLEIKALMAGGRHELAEKRLLDAFRLVFPENYSRIFLEEIPGLPNMLKSLIGKDSDSRAWIPKGLIQHEQAERVEKPFPAKNDERYFLIEPLSDREQAVLAHLATGRSNHQIAEDMNIAVNTVKWHVQNIFSKLGVTNRTAATLAAQQLDLI